MMQYWSNNVNEDRETGELYFNGDFSMKDFTIDFFDDETNEDGYVEFKPLSRIAVLSYRTSLEDSYIRFTYDLFSSEVGKYVCAYVNEYNLIKTYNYALQFLKEKLTEN